MTAVTARQDLLKGIWRENPTLVQTLGMCPTLAVTNSVANSIAMGVATTFVLVASCVLASAVRRRVPNEIRITTFVLIIATFVTIADMALEALVPVIHKALGAFVALIVVNCIILGTGGVRLEEPRRPRVPRRGRVVPRVPRDAPAPGLGARGARERHLPRVPRLRRATSRGSSWCSPGRLPDARPVAVALAWWADRRARRISVSSRRAA
jgi:hypothetical protein